MMAVLRQRHINIAIVGTERAITRFIPLGGLHTIDLGTLTGIQRLTASLEASRTIIGNAPASRGIMAAAISSQRALQTLSARTARTSERVVALLREAARASNNYVAIVVTAVGWMHVISVHNIKRGDLRPVLRTAKILFLLPSFLVPEGGLTWHEMEGVVDMISRWPELSLQTDCLTWDRQMGLPEGMSMEKMFQGLRMVAYKRLLQITPVTSPDRKVGLELKRGLEMEMTSVDQISALLELSCLPTQTLGAWIENLGLGSYSIVGSEINVPIGYELLNCSFSSLLPQASRSLRPHAEPSLWQRRHSCFVPPISTSHDGL